MKTFTKHIWFFSVLITAQIAALAQNDWPRTITASDQSVIKIYQPQPESLAGNELKFKSVFSVQSPGQDNPVFGMLWSVAAAATDNTRQSITIQSVKVPNLKLAPETEESRLNYLKAVLETELPSILGTMDLGEVQRSISRHTGEKKLSETINNQVPEIIYADRPSMLILIDGEPRFQHNPDWGVDVLVNSPFTIARTNGNQYYLYGGDKWFTATSVTGPYHVVSDIPENLHKVESTIKEANKNDPSYNEKTEDPSITPEIIVRTHPAELLQTDGEPNFVPIEGTGLTYISNSGNDVFMNTGDQQYYVLIAGRWFRSPQLKSGWQYVSAGSLPNDFAKIPKGSPKDNVLASVPGTKAAKDAVIDAQVPQVAKVDRNQAKADVTYDGEPRFSDIPGTHMQYGVNTPSSVIKSNGKYYLVDNGVWFESPGTDGPWKVATDRPAEINNIPPSSPAYNLKYVYIYDVTPDWVYMGYTPGYLNAYIYGPTVVYGTGYHYNPWWGHYYYPRPYTWGFSFQYNPWYGWGMGFGLSMGWLNIGFGTGYWNGWAGGWWGPHMYHPPYHCYSNYGYYGNHYYNRNAYAYGNNVNRQYTSNMYGYRRDVTAYGNRNSFDRMNNYGGSRSPDTYGSNGMPNSRSNYNNGNRGNGRPDDRDRYYGNGTTNQRQERNYGGREYQPQQQERNYGGREYQPQQQERNYGGREYQPQQQERNYGGRENQPQRQAPSRQYQEPRFNGGQNPTRGGSYEGRGGGGRSSGNQRGGRNG